MKRHTASNSPLLAAATQDSGQTEKAVGQSSFDQLPDSGYIRQSQLIPDVVPVSPATLWRNCKAGQFPKPVKLSERVTAWRVGDVRAWLIAQAKAVQS
jgi:predicted DNA-binding transcriptional regulator AlpA